MTSHVISDIELVADGLGFPEGPVAFDDGSVLCTEITSGHLIVIDADGTAHTAADVGGGPNGAARGPDGAIYVCNNGGIRGGQRSSPAIQRVDLVTSKVDVLYIECDGRQLVAPNDLVFDDTGSFWFTDLGGDAIYYAAPDGTSIVHVIDARGPNGIGLSPESESLYWAQTYTRQVMRRRLEAPGRLVPSMGYGIQPLVQHGRVDADVLVAGLSGGQELDSLAIDTDGAICVGTLVDSGITVVSPDGSTVKYTLPPAFDDGAVTNIAFGGTDMRTAYITLSLTGRLIACHWPTAGLRLAFQG